MPAMGDFAHRGVIEGFYGKVWTHEDRRWLVERMGGWGMNRFVHAPKNDPLHRAKWREPYPDEVMAEFRDLVATGERAGVTVGFAVSPGLSIAYSSRGDREALVRKLRAFQELGARLFGLLLDDVPAALAHAEDRSAFASLGEAHVSLAHAVREALGPDAILWLVPTDYLGVEPTDYLETLGAALAPEIEVGWTGRTVVSPTIEASEAAARAKTLRRKLLLWDNTPVSDGSMHPMLHLNPFAGRSPELAEHASGILLNPMEHARASGVTLRTAADYLADPGGYDAEASWRAAVGELGAGAEEAFATFAHAHRFSALAPDDRDRELEAGVVALREAIAEERDPSPLVTALREAVARRAGAPGEIRERLRDRRLLEEIEPWLASCERETRRMDAALGALSAAFGDGPRSGRVFAFFGLEVHLTRNPAPDSRASFGPRRVLYPQLSSMRDDAMGIGADPALFVGRCLSDELVALAEEVALARLRAP